MAGVDHVPSVILKDCASIFTVSSHYKFFKCGTQMQEQKQLNSVNKVESNKLFFLQVVMVHTQPFSYNLCCSKKVFHVILGVNIAVMPSFTSFIGSTL